MFFINFICDKCGNNTLVPDFDNTIDSYIKNDFNSGSDTILLENTFKKPDYIMFKCENQECGRIEKLTEKEILDRIIQDWSEIAFNMAKSTILKSYEVQGYKTRYLYDDKLNKFFLNYEVDYQDPSELYNDYFRFVKNEESKRNKKR